MAIADLPPPVVLTCSVLGESRGRNMVFQGQIVGRADVIGSYRLLVGKEGPSGSSQVAQSGNFAIKAGETLLVGSMMTSVEPGAEVDAALQLIVDGQPIPCQSFQGNRT